MTTETSDIPATRQRAGARRAVDVVYLPLLFPDGRHRVSDLGGDGQEFGQLVEPYRRERPLSTLGARPPITVSRSAV
jgi:hypothetical protein